jgi:hypothetical protein
MRIDSAGNVGIGETDPATALELSSTAPYITIHNTTEEDGSGGREGRINFKGEQSGAEETTLGRIELSHDGGADNEKGIFKLYINDGSDGDSPTLATQIDSSRILYHYGQIQSQTTMICNDSPLTVYDSAAGQIIIHNTEESDADNARDSSLAFKGEQSGGEATTLAYILASHDGASDDEKGKIAIHTNDGSDGNAPTLRMTIDAAGVATFTGIVDGSAAGVRVFVSDADVSNPPTNAEVISAFGAVADTGEGFVGFIDDNNGHANVYLVFNDGTKYWQTAMTACA